ncbi:hypothetical protein GLOTRDRAFT_118465 [Gloeophyllum trabeum ATCC 11539]|uniref:F-box domain-containing protein n=1 Tax=Gloeophyllum trabeum (strain ATCC 11539 / FP-39264 / Madison 617) TaxID=670483 RepID=S7S2N1_GLOTA|nr:uncharacterized protein GLOTRDRAFT_118465 [Gloeophyllum trabeum ATCC 11539]EPQ60024.1 hypothetical protein GLOTRDRAFT_118465 [Gloeophyllum trabeum ATCC 11539]
MGKRSRTVAAESDSPTKRARKGKNDGRLAMLLEMPMDILFEILSHAHPLDLLQVTRTSRELRRTLLSPSSTSIWKASLAADPDLPECPPDLSYPRWVHLVYDPYCHNCSRTRVKNPDWRLRVRFCSPCFRQEVCEHVPWSFWVPIPSLLPHRDAKNFKHLFVTSHITEMTAKWKSFKSDEDSQFKFFLERLEIVKQINEHASRCEVWARKKALDRIAYQDQLRLDRRAAIIQKLKAEGYAKDLDSMTNDDWTAFDRLKPVAQNRALTEREIASVARVASYVRVNDAYSRRLLLARFIGSLYTGMAKRTKRESIALVEGDAHADQKPAKRKRKRRKDDKLSMLVEMPMDILFGVRGAFSFLMLVTEDGYTRYKILSHLHPLDLLQVARTSKELRKRLLSRAASSVWKRTVASAPNFQSVHRTSPIPHGCTWSMIPTVMYHYHCPHFTGDFSVLEALPHREITPAKHVYVKSHIEKMRERRCSPGFDDLVVERRRMNEHIYEHADRCEEWARKKAADHKAHQDAQQSERRAAIIQKLKEEGYSEMMAKMTEADWAVFDELKPVAQKRALTDRV